MKKYKFICFTSYDQSLRNRVDNLNLQLAQLDIKIDLSEDASGQGVLGINFSEPEKNPRGAGRKEKYLGKLVTVKEARELMAKYGAEEAAKRIGISRSTLYKRIKKYGYNEDNPI